MQALLDYLKANPVGSSRVHLQGNASDSDGTIVSYLWEQLTGDAVILSGANTQSATFDAPIVTKSKVLTFKLTVTDNQGAKSSDEMSVTLNPKS
jgi:chitinase